MRSIKKMDDAVVGIIATFLITGLIVVVISMIQTVYIPKWMEETEAEHMQLVGDQFSQLKYAIDTQSFNSQSTAPISTSITLGNKEMPFLISSRSYGSLEVVPDGCTITIKHDGGITSYPLGIIKYSSLNSYFINQEFVYEAGGLFLSQSEGDTMSVRPDFTVENNQFGIELEFNMVGIVGEKQSICGFGTYPIQTERSMEQYQPGNDFEDFQNVEYIEIKSDYVASWTTFLENRLIDQGVQLETDFEIESSEGKVRFKFNKLTNFRIIFIDIAAQIGPGWIENIR